MANFVNVPNLPTTGGKSTLADYQNGSDFLFFLIYSIRFIFVATHVLHQFMDNIVESSINVGNGGLINKSTTESNDVFAGSGDKPKGKLCPKCQKETLELYCDWQG